MTTAIGNDYTIEEMEFLRDLMRAHSEAVFKSLEEEEIMRGDHARIGVLNTKILFMKGLCQKLTSNLALSKNPVLASPID